MEIGICAHGLPFDGSTLGRRGLGGSETAVIYVARELSKLGHQVTVFSNPDKPGTYDGVNYVPLQHMERIAKSVEWDVFIVSRQYPMLNMDIKANYRVLWNHDVFTNPQMFACLWQTDKTFLLSDYHIANYTEGDDKVPEFKDLIFKTSNGVDLELIERLKKELADEGVEKDPSKIIYTSRPERGLHYLVQMLPKILAVRPDAKIHYCNYSLGSLVPHEQDQKRLKVIEQLLAKYKDNVVNLGHLTKEQLYREMITAQLLAYPTAFPEISCITAMEAAACGTPIVTTDAFALAETVGHNKSGYLVRGLPDGGTGSMQLDEVYAAKFVRRVLKIMQHDREKERFAKSAPKWITDNGFTWAQVAKSWSDHFEQAMTERYNNSPEAVHKELERRGNFAAADVLAGRKIDDTVIISGMDDSDEAASKLQAEFSALTKSIQRSFGAKPESALFVMPSSPLLPVLMAEFLTGSTVSVYESDPQALAVLKEVFEAQKVNIQFVDSLDGEYDLVVCQDAVAMSPAPSSLVAACVACVKTGGKAVFTTPIGPLASLHRDAKRTRLWSIGPREWNDILMNRFAELSFVKFGMTQEQEQYGKWIVSMDRIEDAEYGPIKLDRYRYERPYQKVTACMIAKDAEDWIVRCLKRVKQVADKIQIVVDTSTTDRTTELIESLDDGRIEWWHNDFEDFETQRNESLRGVGEDTDPGWVFWLDTDEMLVQESGLRKFLNGAFFNGFAIPQCHLMLDVHGNKDNPIRLFRSGRPQYKFIGCIHEHAEDTSKGDYDNPITPSMIIPSVQLAHYGYENEAQRRQKCSNRNMALLQKDLRRHPKRKLNKLLAIRDYLHIPKWELDNMRRVGMQPRIQPGSQLHQILETAIDLYVEHLSKKDDKYHSLAFPHYQEALQILAMCGLRYKDSDTVPFSLATAVTAGVGGPARTDIQPEVIWFRSVEESANWLNGNMQKLVQQIGPFTDEYAESLFPVIKDNDIKFEDVEGNLLGLGANRIDKHGILI